MSSRSSLANPPVHPAPGPDQKTQVVFRASYTAQLDQDIAEGIIPGHLIAESPSALLDAFLMLTKQRIREVGFWLLLAELGVPNHVSHQNRQVIEREYLIAKTCLEAVSGGAERPFTIVKKKLATSFLEKLQNRRVLGGHDPKMESAAAIIEDGPRGRFRVVRYTKAEVRAAQSRIGARYPGIFVQEG
ncbi:MAG: hypothetical protein Q9214_003036 [Letrouitia sp. 1 TL-2023]